MCNYISFHIQINCTEKNIYICSAQSPCHHINYGSRTTRKPKPKRKRKIEKPHRIHTANIILSLCRSRCVCECRLFGVIYLYAHRHKNLSTVVGVCARASNCCCSHRRHRHRVGCKWFGTHSNWPWANNLRTRCVRVCVCARIDTARATFTFQRTEWQNHERT